MIHVGGQTRQNLKQKEALQFRQPDQLLSNAVSTPVHKGLSMNNCSVDVSAIKDI